MKTADINEYVSYKESYLPFKEDSVEHANVWVELQEVKVKKVYKTGNSIKTGWLVSDNGGSYTWMSSQGPIENKSQDLNDKPIILNIMNDINSNFGYNLNSCLVALYSDEKVNQRLHADDEACLESNQSICVVSVGPSRDIEFYRKHQDHTEPPHNTVNLSYGSLLTMLPGCQSFFKHRVPAGHISGPRFSLSFRHILPTDSPSPSIANQDDTEFYDIGNSSELQDRSYSNNPTKVANAHISVLFGTSITTRLDPAKLAKGKRKCINRSTSGATLYDIEKSLDDFYEEESMVPENIERIIYSFGTNDIRFRPGVYRLEAPILKLIQKTKRYFPNVKVYFQSVLPIKINKKLYCI